MFNFQKNTYKLILTLFRLLGLIPRKWALRLGDLMGQIVFLVDKKHRRIALSNLTHAFGQEKTPYEIRLLAKRAFQNLTQILFEIGWSLRLDRKDFHKYFSIKGLSHLRAAYGKGKGVLVLTAHLGNWEFLTIIAAMMGYPCSIVVRPLDFSPLNDFFVKLRTRFDGKLIPAAWSIGKILRSLKRGELVGILLDQNVDWYEGVFVDFFGRMACTSKGLALLALKTEVPVVPLFLVRDRSGFRAEAGQEVPLIKTGDMIKDVEANTEQYNRIIESFIRRFPDQWFWVHQRWKTRPHCQWPRDKVVSGQWSVAR